MGRDRTTTSCALIGFVLATALLIVTPARGARADQAQNFPTETIWSMDVSARPLAPPVAAGDTLIVPLESGVSAIRLRDHGAVWTQKIVATGAVAATPTRVIVPSEGKITALDAATGTPVWAIDVDRFTAPLAALGDFLFVAAGEQLSSYRLDNGTPVWTQPVGLVEQRPALNADWLYVPIADGRIVALDLGTGTQIWANEDVGIKPAEPFIAGDRLFVGSEAKRFCSINVGNGRKDWCSIIGAAVIGPAAADESRVYVVALDNQIHARDRRNGAVKWKFDLRYRPSAGPMVIGDSVAAPGKTARLVSASAATGKPAATLTLPNELAAPPAFIPASDAAPARIAAVTGGLNNKWTLTLAGPSTELPSQKVVPLTVLPGLVVPRADSLAPRG